MVFDLGRNSKKWITIYTICTTRPSLLSILLDFPVAFIVEIGKVGEIRTMILLPDFIYGASLRLKFIQLFHLLVNMMPLAYRNRNRDPKISLAHRLLFDVIAKIGYSGWPKSAFSPTVVELALFTYIIGTFGPVRNFIPLVHLKDVVKAVTAVLKDALDGTNIGEGEQGVCESSMVERYSCLML